MVYSFKFETFDESTSIRGTVFNGFTGFDIGEEINQEQYSEKTRHMYHVIVSIQKIMDSNIDEIREITEKDPAKYELLLAAVRELRWAGSYQADACDYVAEKLKRALGPARSEVTGSLDVE